MPAPLGARQKALLRRLYQLDRPLASAELNQTEQHVAKTLAARGHVLIAAHQVSLAPKGRRFVRREPR